MLEVLVEQLGGRGGRVVVVLDQDGAQAGRRGLLHRLVVIEVARHHRRAAMAMQVDRAAQQLVGQAGIAATPGARGQFLWLFDQGE